MRDQSPEWDDQTDRGSPALSFERIRDLKLAIAADPDVMQFLDINIPDHVATIFDNSLELKGGISFLFSQPFSLDVVSRMAFTCERIGFFMLDTIATDCLYIQQDGLHDLWQKVCSLAICLSSTAAIQWRDSPIDSASDRKPRFWRRSIPCIRPNTSTQKLAPRGPPKAARRTFSFSATTTNTRDSIPP